MNDTVDRAKKKNSRRFSSGSSIDSRDSWDDSGRRRDERKVTRQNASDRAARKHGRGEDRDAPRDLVRSRSKFEDRFTDIQRQSRVDYSSREGSRSPKSSPELRSRLKDRGRRVDDSRRRDSPSRSRSRTNEKRRSGQPRSRSRERLEDERPSASRRARPSKNEYRSDLSDDEQRDRNGTKKSKQGRGTTNKAGKNGKYGSDEEYEASSRPKSRIEGNTRSKRHENDLDNVERKSSPRRKEAKRSEGKLNRGFEKAESTWDEPRSYHPGNRGSGSRTGNPEKSPMSNRDAEDSEEAEITSGSRGRDEHSNGVVNRSYRDSEVELRSVEVPRASRAQSKRNGIVQPNNQPEELTFRARELNNVPDPRSTLCQRTDMMLGVMDTKRDLTLTDAFVFESPKGRRISAYLAAAISVLEAALGLTCGIFLLLDAEEQGIKEYKTYMVIGYMILHGLALISGGLLIWANKRCQLDIMVAWIAIQVSTGLVFIAGTVLFLVVELQAEDIEAAKLLLGVPFVFLSSAFLSFIVLKVLTVAVVISRYRRLTFMPTARAPSAGRPVSTWTEYQPSPEELRKSNGRDKTLPAPEASPGPDDADEDREVETHPPLTVPTGKPMWPRKPPPPPVRTDSIPDGRSTVLGSEKPPETGVFPSPGRIETLQDRTVPSISNCSTLVSEPPRATIPRVTTATSNEIYLKTPARGDRSISQQPDLSLARPKSSCFDHEPQYARSEHYHLRRESPHRTREPPHPRDRSPFPELEPSYSRPDLQSSRRDLVSRPIPAERFSLASRPVSGRPHRSDPEPVLAASSHRYLPTGAVPAIGSPEDWERNHHQYSRGMPRSRANGALLQGGIRRYQNEYEPEPDY